MSLHIVKFFKPQLVLASAALLLHMGAATAADYRNDTQAQVKGWLTGNTASRFAPQSGQLEGNVTSRPADSQEFIRQILLGRAGSQVGGAATIKVAERAGSSSETAPQPHAIAHGDTQAAVRQVLLGQQLASNRS